MLLKPNDRIFGDMTQIHVKSDSVERCVMENVAKLEQQLELSISQLDYRLMKLEYRPSVVEESQQRLELKVDQLKRNIAEPAVQALQGVLQSDREEEQEMERRKKNITVYGITESMAQVSEQRINDDLTQLRSMFDEMGVDGNTVDSVVRLGKKELDSIGNPRPLKVVLDSEENKPKLLRNANLASETGVGWSKVFLHQDLTPRQREVRKFQWQNCSTEE